MTSQVPISKLTVRFQPIRREKVSSTFNNKAKQDFLVAQNRHATTTYGNLVKLLNKVAVNHFAVTLMRLNAGHACINPESNSLTFSRACL